ncbi:MAG: flavodoxin family protein [Treponema sp.]|nr:flavodoxin family protein [Candidatus Treponema equifaecale]
MKVLVLNGSPRKNGTIENILKKLTENVSCDFIDVCKLKFESCVGCMNCRKNGECILKKDDAHSIAEKIKDAEILIVGSPAYWGNINGKMKMLFDRLVYVLMGESKRGLPLPLHKGKKCILVSSCTTPFPFNIIAGQSSGTIRELKEITKYAGFKTIGVIQKGGTKNKKDFTNSELKKIERLNKKIKNTLEKN